MKNLNNGQNIKTVIIAGGNTGFKLVRNAVV